MRRRIALAILLATLAASPALAVTPQLGRNISGAGSGLLDLGRLSQSSEMSFFYGNGSGLRDQYGGLYLSHFTYRFSSPLTMRVSVGARFDNSFANREGQAFLGGFQLAYQPSRNFLIQLNYLDGRALNPAAYDPFGYRGSWLRE